MIIVNEEGDRRSISDEVLELIDQVAPISQKLNCHEELLHLETIIRHGTSAKRQRAAFTEKQSLQGVVDSLVEEFATDVPIYSD
jgi:carboxylate-amine ligase